MDHSDRGRAPLRIGVIGCGLVAQVMHLPYLRELSDRFSLDAICDLSPAVLSAVGERFAVRNRTSRWHELLETPLDAVIIATPGSHAQQAIAAARAGLHVFVEKPMCFSPAEGRAMIDAARDAGVTLMVGNMKRYDPAVGRLAAELATTEGLRLVQVTTLEAPFRPYVEQYPLALPTDDVDRDGLAAAVSASEAALAEALPDSDVATRSVYQVVLLDTLIHELNLLRLFLGTPTRVRHARVTSEVATVELEFGEVVVALAWVDLPGITRYQQELVFYAPDRRLRLSFPSPFLRNAPTELVIEGGIVGAPRSWATREVAAYEEAFKLELIEFAEAIGDRRAPRTTGEDGLADVELCVAIIEAMRSEGPVARPVPAAAG
ncbi:MAG TPA: Gfo/Idh/MocA family oxidoreductase [Candidatus Limnocylindrales bacterium]